MKPATAAGHAVNINEADVRPALDTRANRYDVVSRLADDLAHEIKNPLNAIVVNLEVMRRKIETGATDVAIERAGVVGQEVSRVHLIVDQILQLVRPSRAEARAISIDETLDELRSILEAQAKAARVALVMSTDSGLFVNTTRDIVKFALLNLVVGVYDAEPKIEQLTIETRGSDDQAEIVMKAAPCGLEADGHFTLDARAWVEMAGGTLVLSEPSPAGAGSTAVLRMPACSSFA